MTDAHLIAAHIARHGVTRCPAAIVAPSTASDYDAGYLDGVEATRAAYARAEPEVTLAGMTLCRVSRTVRFDGRKVPLTKTYFLMLELLMTGRLITPESFGNVLWPTGEDCEDLRALMSVHISKLRAKLPRDAIWTRYGQGWFINQGRSA